MIETSAAPGDIYTTGDPCMAIVVRIFHAQWTVEQPLVAVAQILVVQAIHAARTTDQGEAKSWRYILVFWLVDNLDW